MYKSSKSYARISEIINTSRTMYCFMIQRRRKQLSITTYQETNEISCILHSFSLLHPIQNNLQQKFSVNGDNGGYLSIYFTQDNYGMRNTRQNYLVIVVVMDISKRIAILVLMIMHDSFFSKRTDLMRYRNAH